MAINAVTATGSMILNPLVSLWNGFINILPGIVAAIIILIIGYFVALGLGHLVKAILIKAGLDNYMAKAKMTKIVGHLRLSGVLGEITKWYIFLIFIQSAVDLLNLGALSVILNEFVLWLPNVIIAAIIIIFGVALSHFVGMKVEEHTEVKGTKFLNKILKFVILFIVIVIALGQIGVDASILENTFLLLVGAFAIGIAVALGIGLGGALKNESKDIVKDVKEMLHH
ncbi:MAG: hypothetical protein ISS82_03430 [Nanoarchaeota archaeon]|nr:hypothetical protein [Nanoarchaeota archaeon]